MSHSLEVFMRVYDDDTGDYYQIGPDGDGLDLIQLSAHEKSGRECGGFVLPLEAAMKFSEALQEYVIREQGRLIKEAREKSGDVHQG